MTVDRRDFLKTIGVGAGSCLLGSSTRASAAEVSEHSAAAMLNDCTRCVGCRACQTACRDYNGLEPTRNGTTYDMAMDMETNHYTVIKLYRDGEKHSFVKRQCMHCNHPSCVSACPVRALQKQDNGAVTYDKDKCIGCRYCIFACPFNVPRFEYDDPFPQIRKCSLCYERLLDGNQPVCAEVCPAGAITFGAPEEMLKLARARIASDPGRYLPHIYGEREVGGTSVLYLSSVPFADLGLESLDSKPLPELSESVQHGIFKWFAAPIGLLLVLGAIRIRCVENDAARKSDKEEKIYG